MKYVPKDLGPTDDASRGKSDARTWIKNTLSVVITLGALYIVLGFVAEWIAIYIPESFEAKLAFYEIPIPEKKDPTYAHFQRAERIYKEITKGKEETLRPLPYQLYVMENLQANAFAFPGGVIAVTSGLMEMVQSEQGLAMVLGHELGHHEHRHVLRRMGRLLLFHTTTAILFANTQERIMNFSLKMAQLSHSRAHEIEADEFGLRLVYERYGNCDKVFEFFEKIQKENLSVESRWASMLSTHPYLPDRLKQMRKYLQKLESGE